jgi:hypothetical protein
MFEMQFNKTMKTAIQKIHVKNACILLLVTVITSCQPLIEKKNEATELTLTELLSRIDEDEDKAQLELVGKTFKITGLCSGVSESLGGHKLIYLVGSTDDNGTIRKNTNIHATVQLISNENTKDIEPPTEKLNMSILKMVATQYNSMVTLTGELKDIQLDKNSAIGITVYRYVCTFNKAKVDKSIKVNVSATND